MDGGERARLIRGALVAAPLAGLAAGGLAWIMGRGDAATVIFGAATIPVLVALAVEIATSLARREVGLDVVALLSMGSALLIGETLAGVIVALMYAGGTYLEGYAASRARREMTALLERAPKTAMRHEGAELVERPVGALVPGDRILVRQGDVLPADGRLEGRAVLDLSALTGESLPAGRAAGEEAPSGAANAGPAFDMTVLRPASQSAYAAILRLVAAAEKEKAPSVRLADRYAVVFLAVTVLIAGAAWLLTGESERWLAVLVVATPCPLILAVPVAIIAGVSRAAKAGVLVKGGGALERMAAVEVVLLDKTGTLTRGRAGVTAIRPEPGVDAAEMLRLAASLDQASGHAIARAIVAGAKERGLALSVPDHALETAGSGVAGAVDGRSVAVGGRRFIEAATGAAIARPESQPGEARVAVAIDGRPAGFILLADGLRPEAADAIRRFRELGVRRIAVASGDSADVTAAIAGALGLDHYDDAMTPESKLKAVVAERRLGPVMMVGDGVNDAPALAAADVGVAIGEGAAASAEAADAVLLADRLDRLAEAVAIARRVRRIATESVVAGIGLSVAAMIVAAFGYLPPVAGALVQEAIDVAVILNALRALR